MFFGLASTKGILFLVNSLWEAVQILYIKTTAMLNRTAKYYNLLDKTKSNKFSEMENFIPEIMLSTVSLDSRTFLVV